MQPATTADAQTILDALRVAAEKLDAQDMQPDMAVLQEYWYRMFQSMDSPWSISTRHSAGSIYGELTKDRPMTAVALSPSQLVELLVKAIPRKEPVMIAGPRGVGKTDLGKRASEILSMKYVGLHLVMSDPTDIKGLPWAEPGAKSAKFLPFGDIEQAFTAEEPTLISFEDLGQASAATQASVMPIWLDRQIAGRTVSDQVSFMATTNRRCDKRSGVTGMLEPLKGRCLIVELQPNLDDFCNWALSNDMPPELVAHVRLFPDRLVADAEEDMEQSPNPRNWARAGRVLSWGLQPQVLRAALAGCVGQADAGQLLGTIKLAQEAPSLDAIIADPSYGELPTATGIMLAVATGLACKTTMHNFDRIAKYATRMYDGGRGDFAAVLIRDALRRCPEASQTNAYIKMACGPLGKLIGGAA